jgi:ATP-dependent DNA helicase 2 subunit 2
MKARPPRAAKAWKSAIDLQAPATASQSNLASSLAEMQSQGQAPGIASADLAALVSSVIKRHSLYVIKHKPAAPPVSSQATDSQTLSQAQPQLQTQTQLTNVPEEAEEEEIVDREDIVKAWRFGSSWVPIEDDTFEPLKTQAGVEILGFVPRKNVSQQLGNLPG